MTKKRMILIIAGVGIVLTAACIIAFTWFLSGDIQEQKIQASVAQKLNDSFMEKVDGLAEVVQTVQNGGSSTLPAELSSVFQDHLEDAAYFMDDADQNGVKEVYLGFEAAYGFVILNIFSGLEEGELYAIYSGTGIVLLENNVFITSSEMVIQTKLQNDPYYEMSMSDSVKNRTLQAWKLGTYRLEDTDFPETFVAKQLDLISIQ